METSATGWLRLFQITDSAFPAGGYAYSHGLEWLVSTGRLRDANGLEKTLGLFVKQTVRRQWMPAAARAMRGKSLASLQRVDRWLDASVVAEAERSGCRLMGSRLLSVTRAEAVEASLVSDYARAVEGGLTPGQFAVAFAVLGRGWGADERQVLGALGYAAVNSVSQAAVRLGAVGPDTAARLVGACLPTLQQAAAEVSEAARPAIGGFSPMLELAAMLQPNLRFRMFAS